MTHDRVIQRVVNRNTEISLVRRYCDLYDVYLVARDLSTGQEARSEPIKFYIDGSHAFRLAVAGSKGEGDDLEALVGLSVVGMPFRVDPALITGSAD